MDREPQWRKIGEALEYWVLAALVASSLVYGLYCGVVDIVSPGG